MKKLITLLVCFALSLSGYAQFQQDKFYVSAGLSSLDLGYHGTDKWKLDAQVKAGYLLERDWMILSNVGMGLYQDVPDTYSLGAGIRYYIEQNGLFVGCGANYIHANKSFNDVMPTVNLGYAFFLNRTVTIEPELYYNQSLRNHHDYSGFGFRIGLGIYFE